MRKLTLAGVVVVLGSNIVVPFQSVHGAEHCRFAATEQTWTLLGDCITKKTIKLPDGIHLDGDGHSITALGLQSGAVLEATGQSAHIMDLVVQGKALECPSDFAAALNKPLLGIHFPRASGTITNTEVKGIAMTPQCAIHQGVAIQVGHPISHPSLDNAEQVVEIDGALISGYQKAGLVVMGDAFGELSNSIIDGGQASDIIPKNAIQFSQGAQGIIRNNIIESDWHPLQNDSVTGILLFETQEVLIEGNIISGNQVGVAIESWCESRPESSTNDVLNNLFYDVDFAVVLAAYDLASDSQCGALTTDNLIHNNRLLGEQGVIGIYEGTASVFGVNEQKVPRSEGNWIYGNEIEGYNQSMYFLSSEAQNEKQLGELAQDSPPLQTHVWLASPYLP